MGKQGYTRLSLLDRTGFKKVPVSLEVGGVPIEDIIFKGGTGGEGGGGESDARFYQAAGNATLSTLGSLDASHEGFVYNMTEDFTTTSDFVEGAGKNYSAGANVVVVNAGTVESPIYKYDVLGNGMQDSPKVLHLDNYAHDFSSLTDAQVASLKVGDIIEQADYTGYRREMFLVCRRDENDVVYLLWVSSTTDVYFFKLEKSYGFWGIVTVDRIMDKIPVEIALPQSGGILPNTLYKLGTLADNSSNTIRLATPTNTNIANIYHITFNTGDFDGTQESRGPSIMWGLPITTRWVGGSAPAIEPNKYYEVTIMDNIANYVSVSKTITL